MGLDSGAILDSSLTYKGDLIPSRTEEMTYIGRSQDKGITGPWCELPRSAWEVQGRFWRLWGQYQVLFHVNWGQPDCIFLNKRTF